jgi:DNA-directed RNA polymerase specialized sigma24 family protein
MSNKPETKEKKHYIDNKKFLRLLQEYNETGYFSEELHMKFYKLASNYSNISSFRGYSFKEDMIIEGYLRCVRYAKKFDTKEKKNPFAYFTMVIHNEFLKVIKREQKEQDRKWFEMRQVYEKYILENNIQLTLPDNIKKKMYGEDK